MTYHNRTYPNQKWQYVGPEEWVPIISRSNTAHKTPDHLSLLYIYIFPFSLSQKNPRPLNAAPYLCLLSCRGHYYLLSSKVRTNPPNRFSYIFVVSYLGDFSYLLSYLNLITICFMFFISAFKQWQSLSTISPQLLASRNSMTFSFPAATFLGILFFLSGIFLWYIGWDLARPVIMSTFLVK